MRLELLWQVYECDCCKRLGLGFTRPEGWKGFFKFPPTIGTAGQAPLLFVGINPRMSAGNEDLHQAIMRDEEAFEALSRNSVEGKPYIRRYGGEPHYRDHMKVVQGVFGREAAFEDHAAVTELFFCATEDAKGLPCEKSPCANTYFKRVFAQTKPQVVVCVGKSVLRYFQQHFHGGDRESFAIRLDGHSALVVTIAHPNDPDVTPVKRERRLENAINEASKP